MIKTFERNLEVGKFRTQIPGAVVSAAIKGMRRACPLRQMTEQEFKERISMTPTGEFKNDHIMRGTPSSWIQRGTMVYVWPYPVHQWTLVLQSEVKE